MCATAGFSPIWVLLEAASDSPPSSSSGSLHPYSGTSGTPHGGRVRPLRPRFNPTWVLLERAPDGRPARGVLASTLLGYFWNHAPIPGHSPCIWRSRPPNSVDRHEYPHDRGSTTGRLQPVKTVTTPIALPRGVAVEDRTLKIDRVDRVSEELLVFGGVLANSEAVDDRLAPQSIDDRGLALRSTHAVTHE